MVDREYRILLAKDRAGIDALADEQWIVLENTVRPFRRIDTDDDLSFEGIGRVVVGAPGFVALAYKKVG
jgi:hypothetical protein